MYLCGLEWRARRDSNSRPSASKAGKVKSKCLLWCRLRAFGRPLIRTMIPKYLKMLLLLSSDTIHQIELSE